MQRIPGICSLLAAASLAACATTRVKLQCPLQGGPAWREVKSEHIVLQTDLEERAALNLAAQLDRTHRFVHQALAALLPGPVPPPPRLRVVALASDEQFRRFLGPRPGAVYVASLGGDPPFMVLQAGHLNVGVLLHEMTHHGLHNTVGVMPWWLDEGLATYVGTTGMPLGERANPAKLRTLLHQRVGSREADTGADYVQAAMLIRFLLEKHGQELHTYVDLLVRREAPSAAWKSAFPELDSNQDQDVADIAAGIDANTAQYWPAFAFQGGDVPVTERLLGSAEVHAIWLTVPRVELQTVFEEDSAPFLAEIEEGLREDADNVAIAEVAVRVRPNRATPLGRKVIAAHPGSAGAWLLYAGSLPEQARGDREAALRKALDAEPGNARALDALATVLVEAGRAPEAVPLARRAVYYAPYVLKFEDTLASALDAAGDCGAALRAERHVVELLSIWSDREAQEKTLRRFRDLERRCGAEAP